MSNVNVSLKIKAQLQTQNTSESKQLLEIIDHLLDKSIWALGGDGWAGDDIGYGGLDHVIASGKKLIFDLDTESYSNTSGQMSRQLLLVQLLSLPVQVRICSKDLGMLAMSYRNVYVAQIALEANSMQAIRALS